MSTITEATVVTTPDVSHVPWWRGKIVQVAAIVGVMWLAYRGWKTEYPWPAALTWNSLPEHFDDFQTWLLDQRNAENPSFVFAIFDASLRRARLGRSRKATSSRSRVGRLRRASRSTC